MVWSSSLAMGLSHVIVCLCVAGVWCQTSVAPTATPTIPPTIPKPPPEDVKHVTVTGQNETSVTLEWTKNTKYTYELKFQNGTSLINTTATNNVRETQTVSSLTAGTEYNFTLFSVEGSDRSSGLNFTADTAPTNVAQVNVTGQDETNVTLQWNKVNGNGITYELKFSNGTNTTIPVSDVDGPVTYTVSPLNAGTNYHLLLFTVFKVVPSKGYNFSAITRPLSVGGVNVTGQNETSITLQWSKVNGTGITYELLNNTLRTNTIIPAPDESGTVTHIVSPLTAGRKYEFTLFSVFEDVRSTVGSQFSAVTAPLNVEAVTVTDTHRNETSVTLEWKKPANGVSGYVLHFDDKGNKDIDNLGETVTHQVSTLVPGKRYAFTLFTVFEGIKSSGASDFTVTKIFCSALSWEVTSSSIQTVLLSEIVSYGEANNGSQTGVAHNVNGKLSFTDLYPGAKYTLTLWFEKDSKNLSLCKQVETVVPPALIRPRCDYLSSGYAFSLAWDVPEGIWTSVEVNVTGKSPQRVEGEWVMKADIDGVQPAQAYQVSLASISGHRMSKAVSFSCNTDPRGVIAGSVMAVLLLCLLVCLAFFIWRRKPEIFSRPKLLFVDSKLTSNKFKAIPMGKFSDHYHTMSADTNRGFSEEYEGFIPVGTEQTQKAALLEENKNKNRFTNVLPYDWCRVKLTILNPNMSSDYVNANYMPGYSNSRQYIAAQGPLPTTVNDFWRMIWEQSVKGVVMVTNCTEGGRTKCEQYWPLDYTPCLYGDLLVTVRSEKRVTNWTLREFVVKSRDTSEEHPVKHFHFTAWPDHGVPEGTEALIQFRGLVRQHIESQENSGPTVVHCSAGVGRTGTIIALDVMLQQLERQKAVGIAAFVHKMRLSRPLMVQTESQYVFLHQCIMDSLEPKEKMIEEALYENSDLIYANATALREFQAANPKA
ncbi:receptor-type tyrosine-protein phosphatase H-like isoform 1-T1 [Salvelinus alpinus]|uniref:receptor-type tyrosine-protein phosphatase H-like isoform X1 n=1 Tax=Salvelinus alpinus TaxID=8036 RepID=UPI0039FBBE2E